MGFGSRGVLSRPHSCNLWTLKRPSWPRHPGHTEHTYTHTPFSQTSGVLMDVPISIFRFQFGARTPSTCHRTTRAARVRAPSAENRSCVQEYPVSRSSLWVLFPRHTTHMRAPLSLSTLQNGCPVPLCKPLFVCLFEVHIPG